ncbi:ribosomal RNA small subunit methyltransferase A [bacterium]|jgi:16S rRNA (adenine1518-N6/adenine1519-N6)-dimethyltransferase|nr:ribosomal RNA small subunit methyltransferase A [bacterium]MBT3850207.1 ribosomal RNA small subunit methyltransferase A [bacterium]
MAKNIKKILAVLETGPQKKFGQNFLVNEKKTNFIVNEIILCNKKSVVEIGPGLGSITEKIIDKDLKVVCIEKDKILSKYLQNKYCTSSNIKIINEDILRISIKKIIDADKVIFGNLPYNIASKILSNFIDEFHNVENSIGIFMFQKEVADKIMSKVGSKSYNAFVVKIRSFFNVEKLLDLNESDFWPQPKIKSTLIKLVVRDNQRIPAKEFKEFSDFIFNSFRIRRKTLINNLLNIYPKNAILKSFYLMNLKESSRAQDLSVQEFTELFTNIRN